MVWITVIQMIITLLRNRDVLRLLKELKGAESEVAFGSSDVASSFGLEGKWLKALWENREEILSFVVRLIDLFSEAQPERFGSTAPASDPDFGFLYE